MPDSIGARLRQARELRQLSLQEVSEATKVRTHYLQALENDDLSAIPSAAQARGFLRIYAEYLQLDSADLTSVQPRESPVAAPASAAELVATPVPSEPHVGLWAGLRQRLKWSSNKEQASEPQDGSSAELRQAQLPVAQPASSEVKTKVGAQTRTASEEVKKKAMN